MTKSSLRTNKWITNLRSVVLGTRRRSLIITMHITPTILEIALSHFTFPYYYQYYIKHIQDIVLIWFVVFIYCHLTHLCYLLIHIIQGEASFVTLKVTDKKNHYWTMKLKETGTVCIVCEMSCMFCLSYDANCIITCITVLHHKWHNVLSLNYCGFQNVNSESTNDDLGARCRYPCHGYRITSNSKLRYKITYLSPRIMCLALKNPHSCISTRLQWLHC